MKLSKCENYSNRRLSNEVLRYNKFFQPQQLLLWQVNLATFDVETSNEIIGNIQKH